MNKQRKVTLSRNPGGFLIGFAWPMPGTRYVYLGWWLLAVRRG